MKTEIRNSSDVVKILDTSLRELMDEQLTVITLNAANKVISVHYEVTKGTNSACLISSKQIARLAVLDYASGVILVHNHPSGNVSPSIADLKQTEKVKAGLDVLEITLLDHVILGDESYYSFSEGKILKFS